MPCNKSPSNAYLHTPHTHTHHYRLVAGHDSSLQIGPPDLTRTAHSPQVSPLNTPHHTARPNPAAHLRKPLPPLFHARKPPSLPSAFPELRRIQVTAPACSLAAYTSPSRRARPLPPGAGYSLARRLRSMGLPPSHARRGEKKR